MKRLALAQMFLVTALISVEDGVPALASAEPDCCLRTVRLAPRKLPGETVVLAVEECPGDGLVVFVDQGKPNAFAHFMQTLASLVDRPDRTVLTVA